MSQFPFAYLSPLLKRRINGFTAICQLYPICVCIIKSPTPAWIVS